MTRRDSVLFALHLLVLCVLFAPLLPQPGLIPGNFGDIYAYHYPLRHLTASTLQAGRLPLWNPYIFAGTPLAANPQAALFYPASLLHYFLPLSWAFSLDAFLHLLLAWLGAYLLARKEGLDSPGAWTLAAAWGLSPFLVHRIAQGVPTHLSALSWVPWVWLAARARAPLLLAAVLALQVLSGHPQFCLINLAGLGLWLALTRPKRLLALAGSGCLAAFLAAIQALPTLEFLAHSVRARWESAYSLAYSLKPLYLLTLLWPAFLGTPFRPGFDLFPSEFFEMLSGYIGLVPLGLALLGLAGTRRSAAPWPIWALAGCGLFLALGSNNPLYAHLQRALGLGLLRVPARFALLVLWALWLGAASAWKGRLGAAPKTVRWLLALATSADLLLWSAPRIYAQNPLEFLGNNPALHRLLPREPVRIATSPDLPAANKALLYRQFNATGYEAFYLSPIAYYTARSEGTAAADGSRTYIRRWPTPELSRLGVRYYLTHQELPGLRPALLHRGLLVYEDRRALPMARGAARWSLADPEHWILEPSGNEPVVVAQADYPGWKAFFEGRLLPVSVRDGLFSTMRPPVGTAANAMAWGAGTSRIHFRFLPELWFVALGLSLGTLLLTAGLALLRFP